MILIKEIYVLDERIVNLAIIGTWIQIMLKLVNAK